MSAAAMWGFERPWAGLLLLLPLALVLLARRRDRPEPHFTGAFELWLSVAARAPEAARSPRRRAPVEIWCLAAGLALATGALAGPRPEGAAAWRIVVDRSPSMYLPAGSGTRLDRALARLAEEAPAGASRASASYAWIDAGADPPVVIEAAELPAAWRVAPETARGELDRAQHDAPGTVLLTDRVDAPGVEGSARLARATLCAGGGDAAPGLVAVDASGAWTWDGSALRQEPSAGRGARVRLTGDVPEELARFVEVWRTARGHVAAGADDGRAELALLAPATGVALRALGSFGRDGWTASGAAAEPPAPRGSTTWLADGAGAPLVEHAPGRIAVAWAGERGFVLDRGGEAAFAVSFGALLDASVQPAPGVARLEERASAGTGAWTAGQPPGSMGTGAERAARWQAGLAALALLLVLASFALPFLARRT